MSHPTKYNTTEPTLVSQVHLEQARRLEAGHGILQYSGHATSTCDTLGLLVLILFVAFLILLWIPKLQ
jgi:hypothetical protein